MTKSHKAKIKKMLYISRGNIPSRAANALQTMKMASAFSKIISDFKLVVNVSIFNLIDARKRFDIFDFYNIEKMKLSKLPCSFNREIFFPSNYGSRLFANLSSLFARFQGSDVVYVRNLGIAKRCLRLGLNVVLEHHNELPEKHIHSKEFKSPNFLGCITISHRLRNSYISKGMSSEKIIVEQDGVTLSDYKIKGNASDIRKNLILPIDKYILTYSGHLHDFKGIPLILKAAKEFEDDFFLLIGGWEHDIKQLKLECKKQEINNISSYGYVQPKLVPKLLFASDLLLLPVSAKHKWSKDTSPLKMFEYMASGRPIVASNLDNISKVLKNETNALLFEPDSFEDFKEKILFAKENKETMSKIASQAQLDVMYYDWSKRAKRITEFIEKRIRS